MFDCVDRDAFEENIGWVFRLPAQELLDELYGQLLLLYAEEDILVDKDFLYARGTLPVLLVAHVDTVHRTPVQTLCYDNHHQILWSPEGIGGDDRAGVLGILKLLALGHRPHVLFTDGEEVGGRGAKATIREMPTAPDVRFAIQLDRRNGTEAVFYQCYNKDFEEYILGFDFKKATGSFSDISVLCPAWKIAGVNLSCGYYNAHSTNEYTCLLELADILQRVERIFEALPEETFVYNTAPPIVHKVVPFNNTASKGVTYYGGGRPAYLDDDDWDNYGAYNGYGTSYYDKNKYIIPGSFEIDISPYTLMLLHGGEYMFWSAFLKEHHTELLENATEYLHLLIEELLAEADPPQEDDIIDVALDECTEEDKQLLSKK
jgi:hypothetical protein